MTLSICAAGWLHYGAARHPAVFREWIEQSQTIAFNLQIESQRIDRSEPALQLYLLTRDEDKYHFV
ncbi:MAG: hypothetical protein WA419_06770 [Silvibacterium sp.]